MLIWISFSKRKTAVARKNGEIGGRLLQMPLPLATVLVVVLFDNQDRLDHLIGGSIPCNLGGCGRVNLLMPCLGAKQKKVVVNRHVRHGSGANIQENQNDGTHNTHYFDART
jgi:hypothetical protein